MATGKSTVARLIAFCLGGNFKNIPPTIAEEIKFVQLITQIEDKLVTFEREIKNPNQIKVSWPDEDGKLMGVLAPIDPGDWPILGGRYVLMQVILFTIFSGQKPLKVPLSDSPC